MQNSYKQLICPMLCATLGSYIVMHLLSASPHGTMRGKGGNDVRICNLCRVMSLIFHPYAVMRSRDTG
jgi:hypothetical protein